MHDCKTQGGHFFVYKPQNFSFRCRRCNERFVSSYTEHKTRQPWKCLIEHCEYVACNPCSDILAQELAAACESSSSPSDSESPLQDLSMEDFKSSPEEGGGSERGGSEGLRRGTLVSGGVGGFRDYARDIIGRKRGVDPAEEEPEDLSKSEKIEVDNEGETPYDIPIFTRTARQAAAQAALRRTKARPVTRRGEEVGRV